jgi:large subunit ribosomal protein L17
MFRNMVTSLFKYDRIRTTGAKAKELRRWADHIITLAKRGDLHARRQALAIVREKDVVHKLFENANERFGGTSGGYTRIVKLGRRAGDAAPVSLVELVMSQDTTKKKKKKKKPKAEAAPDKKTVKAAEEAPQKAAEKKEDAADASQGPDKKKTAAAEKEEQSDKEVKADAADDAGSSDAEGKMESSPNTDKDEK